MTKHSTFKRGDLARFIGIDQGRIFTVLAVTIGSHGAPIVEISDGLWGGWVGESNLEAVTSTEVAR